MCIYHALKKMFSFSFSFLVFSFDYSFFSKINFRFVAFFR